MEVKEKGRYLCRVQTMVDGQISIQSPWVEEANLLRDVYDKIQQKFGFRNDLETNYDLEHKAGVRGVRLINGEII